jgi:integrase
VIGRRDIALLLFGFAGAFRRSELAALRVADVAAVRPDGLHVRLRRSKTDQEGRGAVNALPYGANVDSCAPCAWARWVNVLAAFDTGGRTGVFKELANERSDVDEHVCGSVPSLDSLDPDTPLFRPIHKSGVPGAGPITGHAVNAVIKRRVAAAGFDPTRFGGHSLRAGFVTEAVRAGADASSIMRQTRHRSVAMVEVYRRENAPLIGNAVTRLGL